MWYKASPTDKHFGHCVPLSPKPNDKQFVRNVVHNLVHISDINQGNFQWFSEKVKSEGSRYSHTITATGDTITEA
jgi:hypothetical protein